MTLTSTDGINPLSVFSGDKPDVVLLMVDVVLEAGHAQ